MHRELRRQSSFSQKTALLVLLALAGGFSTISQALPVTNLVVWDTGSRLASFADAEKRAGWQVVPSNLFMLEADPLKAASDPGYYGREYAFAGDAVVETRSGVAVFCAAQGRVAIYAKDALPASASVGTPGAALGRKIEELVPLLGDAPATGIRRYDLVRNGDDEVAVQVTFAGGASADAAATFVFDRSAVVEIRPGANFNHVRLEGPVEYGILPSFVGDDLIYGTGEERSGGTLSVPAENAFLGLLPGENAELVMTWPPGKQQMRLRLGNDSSGKRLIEAIDFDNAGQNFYLAPLSAPGLWHKEALSASYLEKDVKSDWKRPFPARWKTQLTEETVRTTYAFREAKGNIWRGVAGSYDYPVWFDGDDAVYHLSKKVPPKGESIVYCLEGQNTPATMTTPVDILKATLGRAICVPILDIAGRKLRTHHRRGGDGVHRACTCGCTETIQAFFEAGQETAKKTAVAGALDDMVFFVHCHVERIDEYRRFAEDMIAYLHSQASMAPELKSYLEGLEQIAQQIPQEISVQKDNMKTLGYADELTAQTLALTGKASTNNLSAYMDLLKAWRGMGGAQDYVVAQCHVLTRKLAQEAGYACVDQPKAAAVATEVRARCRQCLRNPDGYEIWPDY